jgi:hypothetical protein
VKRKRFSVEQIVVVLKQAEVGVICSSVQSFSHICSAVDLLVRGSPEGEPKVFVRAFMPLRSLRRDGSYRDSAACPTSYRPRDATWLMPA